MKIDITPFLFTICVITSFFGVSANETNSTISLDGTTGLVDSSHELCENYHWQHCPQHCREAGYEGDNNFQFVHWLNATWCNTVGPAYRAEEYIASQGGAMYLEDPTIEGQSYCKGIHLTLYYFCCHTEEEVTAIREAVLNMEWTSFNVRFDSFGCNMDGKGATSYLHAVPTDQSQLQALTQQIEDTIQAAGVEIKYERKNQFHITIAKVDEKYPVDKVIR